MVGSPVEIQGIFTVGRPLQQDSVRVKVADRLCLENEDNANVFMRENSKRLAGVSRFFHDREQLTSCCLLNIVMLPTDWLMRRLDKLDSAAVSRSGGDGAGIPLIYLLVSPGSSPVSRALVVLADFLKSDGHLGFMLYLWWKHAGSTPEWWRAWALRGFAVNSTTVLCEIGPRRSGTTLCFVP